MISDTSWRNPNGFTSSVSGDTLSYLKDICDPLPVCVHLWISEEDAIQVGMGAVQRAFRILRLDERAKLALRNMLIKMAEEYIKQKEVI